MSLALPTPSRGDRTVNPDDFYLRAIRSLRGRYTLTILIVGLCGALGGIAGWRYAQPVYSSEGLIRVAYVVPAVMKETDQNRPLTMYDAFMRSQEVMLTSYRIIQLALAEPAWKRTGRGDSPEVIDQFVRQLVVERPNGAEHLRVSFSDRDRLVAAAAVRSVIDAYVRTYAADDRQLQEQRFRALDDRCDALRKELGELNATLRESIEDAGSKNLDQLCDDAARRVSSLKMKIDEIEITMALARSDATAFHSAITAAPSTPRFSLNASQDDRANELRNRYVADVMDRDREFRRLMATGLGSNHHDAVVAKAQLEDAKAALAAFDAQRDGSDTRASDPITGSISPNADAMKLGVATLNTMLEQATADLTRLDAERERVASTKTRIAKLQQELDQTSDRRQELQLESTLSDRLEVISSGEISMRPLTDGRIKFGGAGGVFGAAVPLGLIMTFGAMGRRYRFADDARGGLGQQRRLSLLGVLPRMTGSAMTIDQSSDVAQCIHQIRVRLQFDQGPECRVFLVTSSMPREGKTSLSVALSYSMAASGTRTLLIDADLVGQGVTRGFNTDNLPGLHEAIAAGTIDGFTHQRGAGLAVMPAGKANLMQAGAASSRMIRPILERARQRYDVIIIDSGPILGSVEAAIIAPEADGVILTVERGQDQRVVERAIERLHQLRATIAGFVFNRASVSDFASSFYSSSARSETLETLRRLNPTRDHITPSRFGPIVDSMAHSIPTAFDRE